jgi:hypothetical protein
MYGLPASEVDKRRAPDTWRKGISSCIVGTPRHFMLSFLHNKATVIAAPTQMYVCKFLSRFILSFLNNKATVIAAPTHMYVCKFVYRYITCLVHYMHMSINTSTSMVFLRAYATFISACSTAEQQ